jgi:hypothetical protein
LPENNSLASLAEKELVGQRIYGAETGSGPELLHHDDDHSLAAGLADVLRVDATIQI